MGRLFLGADILSRVWYNITNNLSNCSNSNSATVSDYGASYTGTIGANSHYEVSSISVTMGGVDITSTCVSGNTISISSVTGDLVITATSTAITYTITNTLSNCSSNNSGISIIDGSSYSATITADSGYTLTDATISITMGGTDITSTAYNNGNNNY